MIRCRARYRTNLGWESVDLVVAVATQEREFGGYLGSSLPFAFSPLLLLRRGGCPRGVFDGGDRLRGGLCVLPTAVPVQ